MAVSIELTGNPMFPYTVSSPCRTWAETSEKARRLASVSPDAFVPAEHHAAFAPMPPFDELPPMPLPEIPEPLTRDADDDIGLKAGEAFVETCTCPSGDGSLRWPCPAHPPTNLPATDTGD